MNTSKKTLLFLFIISALVIASCNLPTTEPEKDEGTVVAQTAEVLLTQAAQTAQAFPTATPIAPPTVAPTNTLAPTPIPPTITPTLVPCNRAAFVKDVTFSDGSEVEPDTIFEKTWRLRNVGSCPWTTGYELIFENGDAMGAPASGSFTSGTVASGETVDVSVELTSPAEAGTYQGNFKLRSPDNIVFGIHADGQGPFWVKIVVPAPTPTPTFTPEPQADLYITEIVYNPAAPKQGESVEVKVTVRNQGNKATGAFVIEWWSAIGSPNPGCHWNVTGLDAYGGQTLPPCTYIYLGCSTYTTYAIADTTDVISESDETNNQLDKIQVITCN